MISVVDQIAERQKKLIRLIQKGQGGEPAAYLSRYAYPITKDRLGMASLAGLDPIGGVSEENNAAVFVVSTSDEDRDGDLVISRGCRLENYRRNPLWFFGHQEWPVPIGTSMSPEGKLSVWPEENRILAKCYFDVEDPDADFIWGKVKRKILAATSIAFVPIKAYRRDYEEKSNPRNSPLSPPGWVFQEFDLTEISIVGVPANAEAIRRSLDHEKSFITPRLQKALLPYASQPRGRCFSGWCPMIKSTSKQSCSCPDCKQGKPCPCGKETKAQPSDEIDSAKACILPGQKLQGKPLTEAQRGMFGAACARSKKVIKAKIITVPANRLQHGDTLADGRRIWSIDRNTPGKISVIVQPGEKLLIFDYNEEVPVEAYKSKKTTNSTSVNVRIAKDAKCLVCNWEIKKGDVVTKTAAGYSHHCCHKALNESSGTAGGYTVPPDEEKAFDLEVGQIGGQWWLLDGEGRKMRGPYPDQAAAEHALKAGMGGMMERSKQKGPCPECGKEGCNCMKATDSRIRDRDWVRIIAGEYAGKDAEVRVVYPNGKLAVKLSFLGAAVIVDRTDVKPLYPNKSLPATTVNRFARVEKKFYQLMGVAK